VEALEYLWRTDKLDPYYSRYSDVVRQILRTRAPYPLNARQQGRCGQHGEILLENGWLELPENAAAYIKYLPGEMYQAPAGTLVGDWLRRTARHDQEVHIKLLGKARGPLLDDLAAGASPAVWERTLRTRPRYLSLDGELASKLLSQPELLPHLPAWTRHTERLDRRLSMAVLAAAPGAPNACWAAKRTVGLSAQDTRDIWDIIRVARPDTPELAEATERLVVSPATPAEVLLEIASRNQHARRELVRRGLADATVLLQLVKSIVPLRARDRRLASEVLRNPACPPEALRQLWHGAGKSRQTNDIGIAILKHPALPDDLILEIASRHVWGESYLLERTSLPAAVFEHLLRSNINTARRAARHSSCPSYLRAMWDLTNR
jgi:hypothetical protein